MRYSFLFIFCLLVFKFSFAQNKIKISKELYGIYNTKTKKWVVPATYTSLKYLPIYEKSNSLYLLVTDKKGAVLLDAIKFKNISPIYETIDIVDAQRKLFIIKDKNLEYFYRIGEGILSSYPIFDSHKFFANNENELLLKKGNNTCVFNKNNFSFSKYTEGELTQHFDYQQFLVKLNGKYGVVGMEGNSIIPKEYDTLIYTSDSEICRGYLAAKKQNKWGVITDAGSEVIPLNYEGVDFKILKNISRVSDSCLNLYPIKLNGKWGFVNDQNKVIITTQFDSIINYINPSKFTVIKNGKRGIIDVKGNILFPFNYKYFERIDNSSINAPNENYYLVNNSCLKCEILGTEGGWGIADSTGKLLQEMNASFISLRDAHRKYLSDFDSSQIGFLWNIGGEIKTTVIDSESVEMENYDEMGNPFYSQRTYLIYSHYFIGGKTGIIDLKGKILLPIKNEDLQLPLYRHGVEPFEENGITTLHIANRSYRDNYIINQKLDLRFKQGKLWGVAKINGEEILPCFFDSIQSMHFNRYDICEVSDSIQNTLNFPLEQYKCWKGKIIYFYTKTGQFLSKRLQQEQFIGDLNFVLNPPNKGNYYFTPVFDLIAINPNPEFHSITTEIENEEPNDYGEWIVVNKKHTSIYYTPTANKFNFFNPLSSKYLFPELVEDFILLANWSDRELLALQWSVTTDRIKIASQYNDYNNIIEKLDQKKAIWFSPYVTYQRFGRYDSTIFVKQNNKWFIRNLNEANFKNKIGFDSVYVNTNNSFIGYNNGTFATYNFNETQFNKTKINLEFPSFGDHKLACTSCEYTYVEKKTKTPQVIYDEVGNEIQVDTLNSITKIPLITKGKLNITNTYSVPILENWVDEIIFPSPNYTNNNINLSDKNDSLFSQSVIYDFELSNINNAKTIAYRIDKDWYLITLNENKKIEGPFDTIKRNESFWEATKSGLTKRLKVYDLTEK